jgi:DNA-binding GntR family transcriptional regulator
VAALSMRIARPPGVADLAYDALRELLTRGELAPDEKLVEAEMTLRLGVSRTPVREALTRLAAEGFLTSTPSGFRVPTITAQDIRHMSQIRVLLEPEAARQAAANASDIGLVDMRAALKGEKRAHSARDTDEFVSANGRFRKAWLMRAENPMLLEALTKAMRSLQLIRRRTMADHVLRQYMIEAHRGLLARIEERDPQGAAAWQAERIRGFNGLVLERLYGVREAR